MALAKNTFASQTPKKLPKLKCSEAFLEVQSTKQLRFRALLELLLSKMSTTAKLRKKLDR